MLLLQMAKLFSFSWEFGPELCKLVRKGSAAAFFCILLNDRSPNVKTCNRVKTTSLFFAIGKMNDRSIMTSQTSQSKKLPSKTMTNYCNAWKNKWLSTKAQQVFLTLANKLLSTQEDYQLRHFIFTIIHPGTFKVINLTIIKPGALY